MTDTRYPIVWVVTSSYIYYPSFGTADWVGVFVDEDAARECYTETDGQSVSLIVLHNDGSLVKQVRK